MRIGIDARPLSVQPSGVHRVVSCFVRELERIDQEDSFYLYSHRQFKLPFENPRWHKRIGSHASSLPSVIWFWTEAKRAIRKDNLDVFWSAVYIPPLSVPLNVATILTVHDLEWRLYPETMSLKTYWAHRLLVWPSVRQADKIISDSESTARDLRRILEVPESKIEVVYLGVGAAYKPQHPRTAARYVASKYGVSEHYALTVGTVQPRKNLDTLVEAMKILRDRAERSFQLLVAGARGWKNTRLYETIKRLALTEEDVHFLGFVPEEDLPMLYSGSCPFVFPSLYEGFGLPLVEAMACGVPVVATNASSIPEVVGDAALLVPPTQPEAFAEAIMRVRSDKDLRKAMIEKGLSRAACFRWDKAAGQLLECMRHTVAEKRSARRHD